MGFFHRWTVLWGFSAFSSICLGRISDVNKRGGSSTCTAQIQNICDRRYSATTVVGNKLFLNGGQDLVDRGESTLDYGNFDCIQYIDLSSSWSIATPPLTTSSKPISVTTVDESCAWSDGTNFYQYGGWQITENIQESFKIWEYETTPSTWTTVSTGSTNVQRLASGGYTNAPKIKKSYAFGGFMDGATTSDPWYAARGKLQGVPASASLVEFDWSTKTAKNITYTNNTRRNLATLDNSLAYVPVGDSGILLSIGGRDTLAIEGYDQMENLSEIKYYDIASATWYFQAAEGAVQADVIPISRVEPCTVVQPAADGSSYNVYMFGGSYADNESSAYNDMWILSLPSFKWFKVNYPAGASSEIAGNRTSHTCQIIGNRQMAIIGGGRSADAHEQCKNTTLFIFDMSTLSWRDSFNPTEADYVLPALITDVIGGNEKGNANATLNLPSSWSDVHSSKIFAFDYSISSSSTSNGESSTKLSTSTSTSTADMTDTNSNDTSNTSKPISKGPIIGGVVGGIFVIAILGIIVILYRRNRRKSKAPSIHELSPDAMLHELQAPFPPKVYQPASGLHELQGETGSTVVVEDHRSYYQKTHGSTDNLPPQRPSHH